MKMEDIIGLVKRFKERPISGRKLYIYQGNKDTIKGIFPSELLKEVDILQIIPDEEYPDDASIQKAIKGALRNILQENIKTLTGQQALLIINSWLLTRYKVPIALFYQYYLGDRTMVIFHIDNKDFNGALPEYTKFYKDTVHKYFERLLPEDNKDNILQEK